MTNTTIWKFPGVDRLKMPKGAEPIDVQLQNGRPVIWAEVEPRAHEVTHLFKHVMTGQFGAVPGPEDGDYLGTYQDGWLVFHVYDLGEERP